jgi:amino acid transporter
MDKVMKRHIGLTSLVLTGLGSILGSGWLFGAWRAAKIAGPAAIVAWLIGALVILMIALTYAELGAMFPQSGGMVRYAYYSHGPLTGFISAWANWIAIVSVIPIEAEASIQYMSSWPWQWAQNLYANGSLQPLGLLLSGLLIIVYFLLNYWGAKALLRANFAITLFKFAVPIITAVTLIASSFHTSHLDLYRAHNFAPYGWSAILTAVATSGVVMSFNGFQSPINLAGEAKNPTWNVPFAVISSILISLVIYLLLQVAFISAAAPAEGAGEWNTLEFSSPFAQLAIALNLNWLAMLLYLDAFASPSGTGIIYMATTSRMIYALERNHTLPRIFGRVHPLYGVPRPAMWLNLGVAFLFMFFFRGWSALAAVISVMTVISYLTGPISLMALRHASPALKWPLRIPGMQAIAPIAFMFASLIMYGAHWPLTGKIIVLIIVALPFYFYYQLKDDRANHHWGAALKSAWWLIVYLPVMALVSYCGSAEFGGRNIIPFGWDIATVSILSLAFYFWGIRSFYSISANEVAAQT